MNLIIKKSNHLIIDNVSTNRHAHTDGQDIAIGTQFKSVGVVYIQCLSRQLLSKNFE
jgi:hypothetical protein